MNEVPQMNDKRVIACNYAVGTSEFRPGALCYVSLPNRGNNAESIRIRGRSRGGRWITKWEKAWRLINFRWKTLPPEHPRFNDTEIMSDIEEFDLTMMRTEAEHQRVKRSTSAIDG